MDIELNTDQINYNKAHFIISAPTIRQLPTDTGVEIAFAGRSNAGKSSALNRLTNQKNLAKTSKTPGRTQLINLFKVAENCHIADLPGYGFAKVPLEVKHKWQKSLGEYLQKRESLQGIVILMDIRHPLKDLDMQVLIWAIECYIPVQILLTKADKLKSGACKKILADVINKVLPLGGDVSINLFSSLNGLGVDTLQKKLTSWFVSATEDTDNKISKTLE